eukprot:2274152-Pyramimonas_sp.AAC.1
MPSRFTCIVFRGLGLTLVTGIDYLGTWGGGLPTTIALCWRQRAEVLFPPYEVFAFTRGTLTMSGLGLGRVEGAPPGMSVSTPKLAASYAGMKSLASAGISAPSGHVSVVL